MPAGVKVCPNFGNKLNIHSQIVGSNALALKFLYRLSAWSDVPWGKIRAENGGSSSAITAIPRFAPGARAFLYHAWITRDGRRSVPQ